MPLIVDDVIQLLAQLADDANLTVAVKESLKGGVIAGLSAVIGALVMGPTGLAIGGTVGGMAAAYLAHGKFQSVGSIIRQMDPEKQKKLYQQAMAIFNEFSVTDIVALNALIAGDTPIKADLIGIVIDHLHDNLQMEVQK